MSHCRCFAYPLPTRIHTILHTHYAHTHAHAEADRLFVSETVVVWDRRAETKSSNSSGGGSSLGREAALR